MSRPEPPQPILVERLLDIYPSLALLAGLQLRLFTQLSAGPQDSVQLAAVLGADLERLRPLLYALAAAGLLEVRGADRFANGAEAQEFLVEGRPSYLGEAHPLYAHLWQAGFQVAASIRAGRPQACHDFAAMSPDHLASFLRGSHPDALATGAQLAARPEFAHYREVLDVGGGSGGVAIALTRALPVLRATVVELPAVLSCTQQFVAAAGAAERIRLLAADLVAHPLLDRFDAAVLKSFLQVLGPAQAQQVLVNLSAALHPGGRVYILGMGLLDDSRLTPRDAALFGMVFPSLYEAGRAYTESEYRALLAAAGFEQIERTALDDGAPLIAAHKPK